MQVTHVKSPYGLTSTQWGQACLVPFLLFVLTYASMLLSTTISIDDEYSAVRTNPAIWARQGRWVAYVLEGYVLSQPIVIYFPLLIFGALVSIAYPLLLRAHDLPLQDWRSRILFVPLVAFPTTLYLVNFKANSIPFGIGILAVAAVLLIFRLLLELPSDPVRLAKNRTAGLLATQVLAVAVAVGAYQSLLLFIAAGAIGALLMTGLIWRLPWQTLVRALTLLTVALALGVMISEAISFLLRWWNGVSITHINRVFQPQRLLEEPLAVISATARAAGATYLGSHHQFGLSLHAVPVLIVLGVLASLSALRKNLGHLLIATALLTAVLSLPFALNLLSGGALAPRALVAVPYAVWLLGMLAVYAGLRPIRVLATVTSVILGLQCLYTVSHYQTNRAIGFQYDQRLAAHIYQRIAEQVPGFDRSRDYWVHALGAHRFTSIYPDTGSSTFSASFFEREPRTAHRAVAFMRVQGYVNLRAVELPKAIELEPEMRTMPIWPAAGSVQFQDDIIRIRLGE